eukprot:CAMPEP_0202017642 /NCGR_PEP_ID=MMETSP0905-20130828/37554_1 /ASSEMBLY_ACC=CAM_ASM_000554 /TAXON_ID=420261 /ORGANISM="Thalassiosira antarctica, Strain CCMP982" /LENGTH=55 /DNA_ID=CAMNT_0048578355 /DNA_START=20 /DNA_END=187 /DNA_ORIENTATION=+
MPGGGGGSLSSWMSSGPADGIAVFSTVELGHTPVSSEPVDGVAGSIVAAGGSGAS